MQGTLAHIKAFVVKIFINSAQMNLQFFVQEIEFWNFFPPHFVMINCAMSLFVSQNVIEFQIRIYSNKI